MVPGATFGNASGGVLQLLEGGSSRNDDVRRTLPLFHATHKFTGLLLDATEGVEQSRPAAMVLSKER